MDGSEFIDALRGGRQLFGTLILSPLPKWLEVVKGLDIDCVFLDTEHTPMDWNMLGWMCRAYRSIGIAAIVRIPSPDPFDACRVIDVGASAVVSAYIETAEQVTALRSATKMRPIKGKKLDDLLSGKASLSSEMEEYVKDFNSGCGLIVNIESVPAIEALDEILAVPGLDGVLIGPHDLSCSLEVPEQYDHPDFIAAVETIAKKARAANVGAGIHNLPRIDQDLRCMEAGMNLILRRSDIMLFKEGMEKDLEALRGPTSKQAKRATLEE